jgi:AAA15 family ATPase/GTPase
MCLIKHIKLRKPHKGITENVILRDLGKINVICGKNNSGKTSILEQCCPVRNLHTGIIFENTATWGDFVLDF